MEERTAIRESPKEDVKSFAKSVNVEISDTLVEAVGDVDSGRYFIEEVEELDRNVYEIVDTSNSESAVFPSKERALDAVIQSSLVENEGRYRNLQLENSVEIYDTENPDAWIEIDSDHLTYLEQ